MFSIKAGKPNRILIRGIFSMAIGLGILLYPGLSIKTTIQILGGILFADGLVNWLIGYFQRKRTQTAVIIIPRGFTNMLLGIVLFVFPAFFVGAVVFIIGFLLIVAGSSQLLSQINGRNLLGFSWVYTIFSLAALVGGAFLLTKPFESATTILAFFGIVIALYGAGEVFWSFKLRKFQKQNIEKNQPDTVDADYEEVE